jgi:hypothetical protein
MATKPRPFDVGTSVVKKVGGGMRIQTIVKMVGPKTWEIKFFDGEVIETLNSSQLLRPKDSPTEAPAEATIQVVIPMLSVHDSEGSYEGSDEGSDKVILGVDRDDTNNINYDNPGIDFLPDEEEYEDNNDSNDDRSLLPHRIEIRCQVMRRKVTVTTTPWMQLTMQSKRMSWNLQLMTMMTRLVSISSRLKTLMITEEIGKPTWQKRRDLNKHRSAILKTLVSSMSSI